MPAQTLSLGFAQTLQFGGAKRVLRHRTGDAVDVIDGLGMLYLCCPTLSLLDIFRLKLKFVQF